MNILHPIHSLTPYRAALLLSVILLHMIPLLFSPALLRAQGGTGGPLIPRKVLFGEPEYRAVQLSPDGKSVGYLASHQGRPAFWLLDAGGTTPARVIPTVGPVGQWAWSYDNRLLFILPERGGDRLILHSPGTGDTADITPVRGTMLQIVAQSLMVPTAIMVAASSDSAALEGLYRVDLAARRSTRVRSLENYDQGYFDGSLRLRAARRSTNEGDELVRFNDQGEAVRHALYGFQELRVSGVVSVSADGKTLYLVDNIGLDKASLKEVDLATGRERILLQDTLVDLLSMGGTIDPMTGRPGALVSYYVRMRRHMLDPSLAADFDALRKVRSGDVSYVGMSLDKGTWLVRYMDGAPLEYYLYDRASKQARPLFNEMPALSRYPLAKRTAIFARSRDGLELPCDLYLPPGSDADGNGRPDKPLPTLIYVHGGPWIGFEWNIWPANRNFQLLANRGYAVIRADFRGAGGYGRKFMDAGNLEFGGKMLEDVVDIAGWASREGVAEADKIGIWGWSYGGYAAFSTLAFWPDVFACGISMYGLGDLEGFLRDRIEEYGEGSMGQWFLRVGDLGKSLDVLRRQSPIRAVERIKAPLLVTHGTLDRIVPQQSSDTMVQVLRQHGKPVTYFVFPEEPHDYRRPENWEAFWAIAERFLHDNLGGRFEPYGDEMARAKFDIITGAEYIPGLGEARGKAN